MSTDCFGRDSAGSPSAPKIRTTTSAAIVKPRHPPSACDCFRSGLRSILLHAHPQSGNVQRTISALANRPTHKSQFGILSSKCHERMTLNKYYGRHVPLLGAVRMALGSSVDADSEDPHGNRPSILFVRTQPSCRRPLFPFTIPHRLPDGADSQFVGNHRNSESCAENGGAKRWLAFLYSTICLPQNSLFWKSFAHGLHAPNIALRLAVERCG